MSSRQFRQDYKQEVKIKKEEAHRKQIRMRETKKGITQKKIDFETILEDSSLSKMKSHFRLQSEIVDTKRFLDIFTKEQLFRLCTAYGVNINKTMTKKDISEELSSKILESGTMPHPDTLSKDPPEESLEKGESSAGSSTVKTRKRKILTSKGKGKGKGKKRQKVEEIVEYPCGICARNCEIDCVCCDICDTWYHFVCLGVTGEEEEFSDDWFCAVCKNE